MKLDIAEHRKDGTIRRTGPLWFRSLLWVLLLLNMSVIFALSSKTAEESTVTSDTLLAKPMEVYDTIHPETVGDDRVYWWFQFIIRKAAHVAEFASLCVWATGLLLAYHARFSFPLGGGFTILYAASDEIHQLLVPGREGKVTDWLFDCLGAVLGLLVMYFILRRFRKRRST